MRKAISAKMRGMAFAAGALSLIATAVVSAAATPSPGPVIIERDLSDPSIKENTVDKQAGYKEDVNQTLGKVEASYLWDSLGGALASLFKPGEADPSWLGYKDSQDPGVTSAYKIGQDRLYEGYKGIGGKDVTDTAKLGVVCGKKPGDAFWVAYPRPGNIEYPPQYQIWHHFLDCYCRCDEKIACPIPDYAGVENWHRIGGGPALHYIDCDVCFGGAAHIRKHDFYVGTSKGSFPGYPFAYPKDLGYQECLRQSGESFGAGDDGGIDDGGDPRDPSLYGI